jgi:hypothetical protein
MKAVEALEAARAAGIVLALDGEDLVLEAASTPPAAVLEPLSQQKADIVAMLRRDRVGWSSEDWQVFFDECSGIAEFDGGLPRPQAEAHAFRCCVVEWFNHNPVSSPPGRCLGCGGVDRSHDPLLPYRVERTGHAWHHSRCWPAWCGPEGSGNRGAGDARNCPKWPYPGDQRAEGAVGDGELSPFREDLP